MMDFKRWQTLKFHPNISSALPGNITLFQAHWKVTKVRDTLSVRRSEINKHVNLFCENLKIKVAKHPNRE